MQLAYSVEKLSEHPLARAIVEKAEQGGISALDVSDFTAIAGYGAQAKIDNQLVYVGKQGLFKEQVKDNEAKRKIDQLRNQGKTVIIVGNQQQILGMIAVQDEIRPMATTVIEGLHRMGIKVAMLTGDNRITAEAFAGELGIDDVRADLKPEEKIKAVRELQQRYGAVAMVGDGINDAPALATATVGMAMGTAGTDAAIEAADAALMADDLNKVNYALNLGKRVRTISRQNIIFSLLILAVLIPSALIGIMTVAMAVFFHEASELLAVANGLRVAK